MKNREKKFLNIKSVYLNVFLIGLMLFFCEFILIPLILALTPSSVIRFRYLMAILLFIFFWVYITSLKSKYFNNNILGGGPFLFLLLFVVIGTYFSVFGIPEYFELALSKKAFNISINDVIKDKDKYNRVGFFKLNDVIPVKEKGMMDFERKYLYSYVMVSHRQYSGARVLPLMRKDWNYSHPFPFWVALGNEHYTDEELLENSNEYVYAVRVEKSEYYNNSMAVKKSKFMTPYESPIIVYMVKSYKEYYASKRFFALSVILFYLISWTLVCFFSYLNNRNKPFRVDDDEYVDEYGYVDDDGNIDYDKLDL